MWSARWWVIVVLVLAACSSPPKSTESPPGFPDLNTFAAVDPEDYHVSGTSFVSPDQIDCVLDFGPHAATACNGVIPGVPTSVPGSGCISVRKADPADADAPYVFQRSGRECASSRAIPIGAGKKLSGKNGTCAVGGDGLVACIDADNKHGFVLQRSGSWVF
jgi:hypothetical protein